MLDKHCIFKVSGAMFAMAINYLVSTSTVCHPKQFCQLLIGKNSSEVACFCWLGDVQSVNKYVLHPFRRQSSETLSRKASKVVTKAFGESLSNSESDSEGEQISTSTKTHCSRGKEKKLHGNNQGHASHL